MDLLFRQRTTEGNNTPKSIIAYYNGTNKPQQSTGIKVKPSNFSNQKVIGLPVKGELNAILDKMRLLFKEEQLEAKRKGIPIDKSVLKRVINVALGYTEIKEGDIKYLSEYIPLFLARMDKMKNQRGTIGLTKETKKAYTSSSKVYLSYEDQRLQDGYSKMSLQHATLEEMDAYQDYLQDEMEYAPDTINKHLRFIVRVSNHAKKRKHAVSEDITYYDVPSKQGRKKEDIIFLNPVEVEMITAPQEDLPDYLQNTQRIVILHLATGQRVSDVMQFVKSTFNKDKKGDIIASVRQQKTNKLVDIPIKDDKALEVIETGLFRAISHQNYNVYIKELARRVGINEMTKSTMLVNKRKRKVEVEKCNLITSHTMRRTTLSNLYNKAIPEYLLLNISGHSRSSQLHSYIGADPNREAQLEELKKYL